MKNLLEKEKFDATYVEAPLKMKPGMDNFGGLPFPLYAIWSPDRQGYLAGMPRPNNNDNIVRDNEVGYKQIKLFITEEKAQEEIDAMIRYLTNPEKRYRAEDGDMLCIKKLMIVRLTPTGGGPPETKIHPN